MIALVVGPAAFITTQCYGNGTSPAAAAGPLSEFPQAIREESFTFLTLPEWFIVYSADEYGRFIGREAPSGFPYLGSIVQYWTSYDAVCEITRPAYPFQTGYHVMLGIIGASFTAENVIKSGYENTVGRLTEWLSGRETPEDQWAAKTAQEYGAFIHTVPWYQFPFGARLASLWSETPMWGPQLVRKWERRAALTAEYAFKAGYGWLLGMASQSAYGAEDLIVYAHVENVPLAIFARDGIRSVKQLGPQSFVVTHASLRGVHRGGAGARRGRRSVREHRRQRRHPGLGTGPGQPGLDRRRRPPGRDAPDSNRARPHSPGDPHPARRAARNVGDTAVRRRDDRAHL